MLTQKLKKILAGPENPDSEFIKSAFTYRDIYAMTADIRTTLTAYNGTVCLYTENKAIIAASVLASLASDFRVILPYALSIHALQEIQNLFHVDTIITDQANANLSGINLVIPKIKNIDSISLPLVKSTDSPFLTFFTGGTTGRTKIWTKTARNLFGEAFFLSQKFSIDKNDCILATVPPYHIYGFLFSVLIPFVSSSKVTANICSFPQEIRNSLEKYSPTILASIPMHYRIMKGGEIPGDSLRMAFSSAGKLDEIDADYFYQKTGAELIEIYGSTETGGIASRCRARGETDLNSFEIIDWKVVDERLYVRSPFISSDIATDPDGFYQTGDRVIKQDEKSFSLLGRADGIVKVGGKRVDLEDVRNRIVQIKGVTDAVAFAIPDTRGRESSICAVIQGNIDKEQLIACISQQVEQYAMPRHIRIVDKIPVSSSGKYDGKSLKKYFTSEFQHGNEEKKHANRNRQTKDSPVIG
jgi:acyl-coenzyme A synthetase/AMP-(fatty) acid ligase